jgi:zinc/manganese transport system permease protein
VNFDAIDLSIIGPALVAGAIVLATHVIFGREVLRRGIIFIDLAVAQMAGLGVIAASAFGLETHGAPAQIAAFAAALLGGLVLSWTDRHFGKVQEAIIGVSFVLAATGGILLLANNPRAGDELRELLVGQILWVDLPSLIIPAILTAVVLAAWKPVTQRLGPPGFYLLFAISVTVSVQLVGVYLVFASLIVPALATRSLKKRGLPYGYAIGFVGYLVGLTLSALFDLPTGAVIVWTLAATGIIGAQLVARWGDVTQNDAPTAREANPVGVSE